MEGVKSIQFIETSVRMPFMTLPVRHKSLAVNSLSKVFEFDFENIILSHGHNVMGGAKQKLSVALQTRGFHLSPRV